MNCMPIDTERGTKVVFAFPNNGNSRDKEKLKRLGMIEGKEYTVAGLDMHEFSTDLYLKEFPGKSFNTVNFSLAPNVSVSSGALADDETEDGRPPSA